MYYLSNKHYYIIIFFSFFKKLAFTKIRGYVTPLCDRVTKQISYG